MQVHITTATGNKISGTLNEGTLPKELLVICHGFQESSDHPALQTIAKDLNAKGHTTFVFNFSKDPTGLNVPQQVEDLKAIAAHFKNRDIHILAGSFSALSASIAARWLPVRSLVTVNGFFAEGKLEGEAKRAYFMFSLLRRIKPSLRRIWRYSRRELQPQAITAAVLVIHSEIDEVVSVKQSRTFYAALTRDKQFVVLQSSDHNLTKGGEIPLIVTAIDEWVRIH